MVIIMNNNMDKKKNNPILDTIIGTIVIILFLGAIAAILYFKDKNQPLCVFIFGAIFFIFGTSAIIYAGVNKSNLFILLFPLIGAGIMFFSGAYMWGSEDIKTNIMSLIPIAALAVFILVGLGMIIVNFLNNYTKKIHCTEIVTAVCIDLNRRYSIDSSDDIDERPTYAPVFKYYFNGAEYTVTQSYYTNIDVPKIDSEVELHINPDDPEEFYRPSFWVNFTIYGMGILFTICGTAALIAYMQNMK
jgi:hypothetical protein